MSERIEKAYYFKKNEFLLMLMIGRVNEIYSFSLPEPEEMDNSTITMTLYRLMKHGHLQMEDDQVALSEEMDKAVECIRTAFYALNIVPDEENEQRICYLSDKGTVVTELSEQNNEIRLQILTKSEFLESLFERSGVDEMPIESYEEGQELEEFNGQVSGEHQIYAAEEPVSLETDLFSWMDRESVLCGWEIQDLKKKVPVKRILFRKGFLNSWVTEQTEEGIQVCYDSIEYREELKNWLYQEK